MCDKILCSGNLSTVILISFQRGRNVTLRRTNQFLYHKQGYNMILKLTSHLFIQSNSNCRYLPKTYPGKSGLISWQTKYDSKKSRLVLKTTRPWIKTWFISSIVSLCTLIDLMKLTYILPTPPLLLILFQHNRQYHRSYLTSYMEEEKYSHGGQNTNQTSDSLAHWSSIPEHHPSFLLFPLVYFCLRILRCLFRNDPCPNYELSMKSDETNNQ